MPKKYAKKKDDTAESTENSEENNDIEKILERVNEQQEAIKNLSDEAMKKQQPISDAIEKIIEMQNDSLKKTMDYYIETVQDSILPMVKIQEVIDSIIDNPELVHYSHIKNAYESDEKKNSCDIVKCVF
ncbi:MAG: hypothetical protein ACOCTT_01640 [archaeon]